MPTLREIFQPRRDFERCRSRDDQSRRVDVLHWPRPRPRMLCCEVTNVGAGLKLNGRNIVPSEFGISFDNFRTMRLCRLIWRDGDFLGAAFESYSSEDQMDIAASFVVAGERSQGFVSGHFGKVVFGPLTGLVKDFRRSQARGLAPLTER
jgi:hypothetical protein